MRLSELFDGFDAQLDEALKPSQYRKYVKGWDKEKWAELFNNKYRIYLPLEESPKIIKDEDAYNAVALDLPSINIRIGGKLLSKPYDLSSYFFQIEEFLQSKSYWIVDYVGGYATKDGKNKKSIGSLLASEPTLKQFFDNDPVRSGAKQSNRMVVISRHPYDIAGASTERGWTSCQNLANSLCNIGGDIEAGSLVAYLINSNDKDIKNPSARIMIKPFTDGKEIALGIQDKIYGEQSKDFLGAVRTWVDGINSSKKLEGIFLLDIRAYNDLGSESLLLGEYSKKMLDNIKNKYIQEISDELKYREKVMSNVMLRSLYTPPRDNDRIIKYIFSMVSFEDIFSRVIRRLKIPSNIISHHKHEIIDIIKESIKISIKNTNEFNPEIPDSIIISKVINYIEELK